MWLWNFPSHMLRLFLFPPYIHIHIIHFDMVKQFELWALWLSFLPLSSFAIFIIPQVMNKFLLWLHSNKKKIFFCLSHSVFLFSFLAICSWIFHIISQYNLNKHLISCSFCAFFLSRMFPTFLSSFRWLLLVWIWM